MLTVMLWGMLPLLPPYSTIIYRPVVHHDLIAALLVLWCVLPLLSLYSTIGLLSTTDLIAALQVLCDVGGAAHLPEAARAPVPSHVTQLPRREERRLAAAPKGRRPLA
eukprot:CAMPEP_0198199284 /NCGR_PEP_ID=MMETSP1445-20131203/2598_1 /TAXON_ID=36898 /ORGANISM="Pyramimonas sp., Strain CCMP2087" /LENGTH=107 /DNA_ID=CAMNT_0043869077 /DNA_START=385 /DNA_END=704 /DNA_ORIENTATION=-